MGAEILRQAASLMRERAEAAEKRAGLAEQAALRTRISAEEGVKPQTLEAIAHARAANVAPDSSTQHAVVRVAAASEL